MPLRYLPLRAPPLLHSSSRPILITSSLRRPFHTTPRRHDDHHDPHHNQNHYETLNVPPTASPAEIKRSYFALSKAHHPDHNPSDPHAARRFMRISEAYAVLSHSDKRARYDRDVLRRHHAVPHHSHKGPSYYSSNPAGGRPPSGLSRRRGSFQGPPPSFFRSGGWGAHSAKRRAAHEETTGTGASGNAGPGAAGGGGTGTGGMGPGQNPYRARNDRDNDVPHFDREAHERTQRRHEERRARRMAESRGLNPFGRDGEAMGDFVLVASILVAVIVGPYMIGTMFMAESGKSKKEKKAAAG
ncbi:DnaJ subfamily A member 3, mitochondrial [Echria macrotheca]|uniref:DnaJ subfamily A member 3, mitochondrial n=1 Tax=Echria macrotheca TaxID=438768 RepID=A0AAJ0BNS5_9PEZI|nr:DnaJ subfamily A member 3, mitochondrial [Echria macrotheca]